MKTIAYTNNKATIFNIGGEYCVDWAGGAKSRWFTRFETAVWFADHEIN